MRFNKKNTFIVFLLIAFFTIFVISFVFVKINISQDSFVKTHITHNGIRYEISHNYFFNESLMTSNLKFEGFVKGDMFSLSRYYSSKTNSDILTNKKFVYFKKGEEPSIFDIEFDGYKIFEIEEIHHDGNDEGEFYLEEKLVSQFEGSINFNSENLKECKDFFDKQNCYHLNFYSKTDIPIYLSVLLYCDNDKYYIEFNKEYYEIIT